MNQAVFSSLRRYSIILRWLIPGLTGICELSIGLFEHDPLIEGNFLTCHKNGGVKSSSGAVQNLLLITVHP
jgi:hypothetical protein